MAEPFVQLVKGDREQRSRHEWSDILPVMLRSTNWGTMSVGRFRQPWSRRLVLVKWVLKGKASMVVSGRRVGIHPGEVAIYLPTQPHAFWCDQEGTEMAWFSVDGSLSEQFVHALGLRAGVYPFGDPPLETIRQMLESFKDQSIEGCRASSLLAIGALYAVVSKLPPPAADSIVHQVRHLVREGLSDPDLSANRLAEQLHYSRGALSRAFRQHSGMTLIECITQTRLQEAEMLLTGSDERIGDVARKCGFRDASYFTRWVRKHTGRLPGELRGGKVDGVATGMMEKLEDPGETPGSEEE